MQASKFPREYIGWSQEEGRMFSSAQLHERGVSISPEGLPVFAQSPIGGLIIMWFSGMIDSKGQKIYEGGICRMSVPNEFGSHTIHYGVMRWIERVRQFNLLIPSLTTNAVFEVTEAELLGNEFENPEFNDLISFPKPENGTKA